MYKMVILLVTFLISKLQGFCLIRVTNFKGKLEKEKLMSVEKLTSLRVNELFLCLKFLLI